MPVATGDRLDQLRTLLKGRPSTLPDGTDCVRLCAGKADGISGLLVDRFGPLVVAVDYAGTGGTVQAMVQVVRDCFPGLHAIAKVRSSSDGSNRFGVASYAPDGGGALVGTERGMKFEIGTDPDHDFGLFLDAAKARAHVRGLSSGKRVLNLFSYTGAFGIAAGAGGATDVVNVDPNKDYLSWSLRNAALNGISMRVLPDTAQDYLAKHLRRLARDPGHPRFDLVIVDPPAFGVGRGKERVLRLLWPEIFAALRTMAPSELVLMCNDKAFRSSRSFGELVKNELEEYRWKRLGTILGAGEKLEWSEGVEDPQYAEPTVMVGTRLR